MDFQDYLNRYAELAVTVGVNVQKMQTLVVTCPVSAAPFARLVARKAYEAGAKHVYFEWADDELTRIKYDLAPEEAFDEYPAWKAKGMEELTKNGAAFLQISAPNPELLKGVDPNRIARANKAAGEATKQYRNELMADKASWCVIAVPSPAWAEVVFPELPEEERQPALWNAIFEATRIHTADPIEAWKKHQEQLNSKVDILNQKQYKTLHYEAPGTRLSIDLPEGHLWVGGGANTQDGVPFMPNIPTEEVFTAPHKDGVNGVVQSTKPLSYHGNLIEDFQLTFENGRIVKATAKRGEAYLQKLLDTDEGARYLGEVALVPHHSPISRSNLIFYNTLFDENASNHLAIGKAYPTNLAGGGTMSEEELASHGLNTSLVHVDFMIGSAEMDIDGERADGQREAIFRNGNWAF